MIRERRQGSVVIRIYAYKGCDSCRKAIKWLQAEGIEFEELAIRETPPSKEELARLTSILDDTTLKAPQRGRI